MNGAAEGEAGGRGDAGEEGRSDGVVHFCFVAFVDILSGCIIWLRIIFMTS